MKKLSATQVEQCHRTLAEQEISIGDPGAILKDIRTLMEFIGPAGIRTGSSQGNLPSDGLSTLNSQLSQPIELPLKRPLIAAGHGPGEG